MRLIVRTGFVLLCSSLSAGIVPSTAVAQSFFEIIFGPSSRPTITLPPSNFSAYRPRGTEFESQGDGSVRTLCVRICDGFYWPVSNSTPRHRVGRDADVCASSCTSEARIFMAPAPGGEIGDAHDLTGRSYKALSTAFVYRKRQVSGCSCRAAPWSEGERRRHHAYALAEGLIVPGLGPAAHVVAGIGNTALPPPEIIAGRPAVEPSPPPAPSEQIGAAEPPRRSAAPDFEPADDAVPIPVVTADAPRAVGRPQLGRPQALRTQPLVVQQKRPQFAIQGPSWSIPQPKYAWPGDAPARYR